jgi:hypothetical protein
MGTRTNRLLVAAAAAVAAGTGFAQPEIDRAASSDPEAQLRAQIAELGVEGGPTPVAVIDPLRTLALLYEESDEHVLAIVALEEARHVTRVHHGLWSADEALLLRQQIRNENALGNDARVWDLEQDMITIARQHHDDIRMVPIFRELAHDRTAALAQYRAGGMPPEIFLGCYYVGDTRPYHDKRGEVQPPVGWGDGRSDGRSCRSGQSTAVRGRLRREILTYYADAIEIILQSEDYASQELRDLEKQAFRASQDQDEEMLRFNLTAPWFACQRGDRLIADSALDELLALELLGGCLRPVFYRSGQPVRANVGGSVSLVRLIAYEIRSNASVAARATAIAEFADYKLVSTHPARRRFDESSGPTLAVYERAYRETEGDDETRTAIFSPAVPVTLPAYEPNPLAVAGRDASPRYIDVAFVVTKHGRGERVEILDTSQGATRPEERDLLRSIERATFRPRFVDGALADSAPVVVRYRLDP